MKEKVYTFGHGGCLVGIVTVPDTGTCNGDTPAVLLWNAGLLHRIGPYRLYVDMARKLASIGYIVFRFDLAGIGDSESGRDSHSFEERAVSDIQEAMNFLSTKKHAHQFVLMGLCSGADNAHQVSVADPRVCGVVWVDGYGYRTWGYYLRHYGFRIISLDTWKNFIIRKCTSIFLGSRVQQSGTKTEEGPYVRVFPSKEKLSADLLRLLERSVNLLYIYTDGVKYKYYNYRNQFKDTFRSIDFQGTLQLEYFDEADHLFTRTSEREKLVITICDWMQAHYQGGTAERTCSVGKKPTDLNERNVT